MRDKERLRCVRLCVRERDEFLSLYAYRCVKGCTEKSYPSSFDLSRGRMERGREERKEVEEGRKKNREEHKKKSVS